MQQNMAEIEQEVRTLKEKLTALEEERDQLDIELKESKMSAEEASSKLNEAFKTLKVPEIYTELNTVKKLLANANQELKSKEKETEALKEEATRVKQLELTLAEKEDEMETLKEELYKANEAHTRSDSKRRIQELEDQLRKCKESEKKSFESLVVLAKQLEKTKILLEESKHEISSLREASEKFECQTKQNGKDVSPSRNCFRDNLCAKETLESLRSELQQVIEDLSRAQERERSVSSKSRSLREENDKLKIELKLACEAEENSKKAMDDLALALKEVATESSQVKLKLGVNQAELEHAREEVENLTEKLKSTKEKYRALLDESRKEMEQYKNTADRLRLEADESLQSWNGKETGFVDCIKKAEDEKISALQENIRLTESLKSADRMVKSSREENNKLRDILKQALNEASVAKEAALIARAENSTLKDELIGKDEALNFLSQEIENLRDKETEAMEKIKELTELLSEKELKREDKRDDRRDDKRDDKERRRRFKTFDANVDMIEKETNDEKMLQKAFSFNLKELRIHTKHRDSVDMSGNTEKDDEDKEGEDDLETEDLFKGSVFDEAEVTPVAVSHHWNKSSSAFTSDGENEDLDNLDRSHLDDLEQERYCRKKKALLRRFGDIIRRRAHVERTAQH